MSIEFELVRKLPTSSYNHERLRENLRWQFAHMADGFEGMPPELVLSSVIGVGPFVYGQKNPDQTRLAPDDKSYLGLALQGGRAIGLPIRFTGDYLADNIIYDRDFLDYAVGERTARADIVISQYVYHADDLRYSFTHPKSANYQGALELAETKPELVARDMDTLAYMGVSRHLPFEKEAGRIFADGAVAVGAKAIIVYGGVNTLSGRHFEFDPFVNMGPVIDGKMVPGHEKTHPQRIPAELLLHKDYLEQLQAAQLRLGLPPLQPLRYSPAGTQSSSDPHRPARG